MNVNYTNKNNKYNWDYIECAFCDKPAHPRRWDGGVSVPLKGPNNEELCHKCVRCYKCGKKEKWDCYRRDRMGEEWRLAKEDEDYGMLTKWEEDENNPSGGWYIAYCIDCFGGIGNRYNSLHESPYHLWKVDGVELGSKLPEQKWENCSHCKKMFKSSHFNYWVKYGDTSKGTMYCGKECSEASEPNVKVKSDGQNQVPNLTDKPPTSQNTYNIDGSQENSQKNDNGDKNKGPVQPVKIIVDKGKSSENNSPPNCQETPPNQENKEMLVIDLRVIKRIELTEDGKLVIEFNSPENSNYTLSQTITAEQVNSSQELQTIKNYCQKNGKNSLSQSELNNVFSTHNTNSESNSKPTDNNNALTIGLSVAAALIVGLAIGLLFKRKKRVKRS